MVKGSHTGATRCYLGDKLGKFVSNYSTIFEKTMDKQHCITDKRKLTMATNNKNKGVIHSHKFIMAEQSKLNQLGSYEL